MPDWIFAAFSILYPSALHRGVEAHRQRFGFPATDAIVRYSGEENLMSLVPLSGTGMWSRPLTCHCPVCCPMPSAPALADASAALVHDWLNQMGGAEYVLEVLHDMLPQAPIYTSLYHTARMPARMQQWDIRPSFLNHLPFIHRHPRLLLPLYPAAFARTDLSDRDLVVSVKSAFCLGVTTRSQRGQAQHVCYCLTPTRFLWDFDAYMQREAVAGLARRVSRQLIQRLRRWEVAAAREVDIFIAISRAVQQRIRDCYGRESTVIHPPVDTRAFQAATSPPGQDHYLIVSRLIPYKRIDLAVAAFNRMPDRKLIIVGEGRDAAALQAAAQGNNIAFTGYLPRTRVVELMTTCRAFVFPGEEDFGITPVEALSAGKPVIAYGAGGALDYVRHGTTGILFPEQTPEALAQAVEDCATRPWDPVACRRQARQFSVDVFRQKMGDLLVRTLRQGTPLR